MFLLPKTHWKVIKTKSKGKGVFATADIEAGTVIGDYLGKVISSKEEEEYEKKHGFYSMYYHDKATIFPNPKADGIHLINHSCAPNCWMYTYKGHTLYFSIRKIFKGEEITISYLLAPQDKDCKPCTDHCLCGSFNCSQTMHMPKIKYDAWTTLDDATDKKTKAEKITVNTQLQPLKAYPKNIADNKLYTLIGNPEKNPVTYTDSKLPSKTELRTRIRKTGRHLRFPKVGITVYGVNDNVLLASA